MHHRIHLILWIGKNRFSLDRIELDIHESSQTVKGKLTFDSPHFLAGSIDVPRA